MPQPEKSPAGVVRRQLDHDALDTAITTSRRRLNDLLDALDKADQREAQLARAKSEARRQSGKRFDQLDKPRRK